VWGMRRGLAALDDAEGLLHQATDAFDMALQRLGDIARESSNPGVHTAVAKLTSVLESLRQAHGHSAGFGEVFGSYLTQIGADGVSASPGGDTAGPGTSAGPTQVVPKRRLADFTPARPHKEAVADIRRLGWPKNRDDTVQARGRFFDADGTDGFDGRHLQALPGDQVHDAPELQEPWRNDRAITTSWHVEGEVAAYMRRTGTTDAVLYLNIPTCGNDNRDPKRCFMNTEKILPVGSTLTVWSIHENGERRRVRFHGTGEAIRP